MREEFHLVALLIVGLAILFFVARPWVFAGVLVATLLLMGESDRAQRTSYSHSAAIAISMGLCVVAHWAAKFIPILR